jgi:hypothetical protein
LLNKQGGRKIINLINVMKKLSPAYLKKEAKEKNTPINKKHEARETKGKDKMEHKPVKLSMLKKKK